MTSVPDAADKGTIRPRLLDVVVWAYVGTALLNFAIGTSTLAFLPAVLDELRKEGAVTAPGGVFLAFALVAAGTLAYSLAIVLLAFRLRRGNRWARPALLTISLLSLAGIVTSGAPGAAVILLLLVLAFLVTRPEIGAWLKSETGRSAR